MKNLNTILATCLLTSTVLIPTPGYSIQLIDGLGGPNGYGELAMQPNDDGSSNELNLPFEINFFGQTHSTFFINNNGNVTFNEPVSEYTPQPFPVSNQPMIAPFWSDVDTGSSGSFNEGGVIDGEVINEEIVVTDGERSCPTCGDVYVASPNEKTTVVTWNDVGFFPENSSKTNNFQLILRDQDDGDFDIEFRYDRLEWTTGDASDGENGLGGTPAQAGFDAGNTIDFFVLPGSFTDTVLDLANTTNVAGGENGLWSFAIRDGVTPGETADNPLLPVIVDNSFVFEFGVALDQVVFIDPDVAIGYDYVVTGGPSILTVELPTGFGDDIYEVQYIDANGNLVTVTLNGGNVYTFVNAVNQFTVLGIEESLGVDPTDITAFVTALTFDTAGIVQMNQTPITVYVDPGTPGGNIPEPQILALFGIGLIGLSISRRRSFKTEI